MLAAVDLPVGEAAVKPFCAKYPRLGIQSDYESIESVDFWQNFPSNFVCPAKSPIDHVALSRLADAVGTSNEGDLSKVVGWIRDGVDIGCKGQCRAASVAANTKGAYVAGQQVSDAIAGWVEEGLVFGPVEEHDVPAGAKINSILTRPKPNGSVRIILNLSAPEGISVNDGIDVADFPAVMSSTEAWLAVLNKAGRGCMFAKTDWANAYKHLAVKLKDTDLQWFMWGGKFFKELMLVFGGSSSAGIFDLTAKVVLDIVCRLSGFPRSMVCQHLDDIIAAAAAGSVGLKEFDDTFQYVAGAIGVKLAPRDDPDKSFGPSTVGVVFGVLYDTEKWTWALPPAKLQALVGLIKKLLGAEKVSVKEARSLVGKLVHIRALLPGGRFNVAHVMALGAEASRAADSRAPLELSAACKRQLHFWAMMLIACNGEAGIPRWPEWQPAWAMEAFCDAAGGSLESAGRGSGGVLGPWWYYIPWAKRVNAGKWEVDGKKVGRKLTALELVGPLVFLVAGRRLVRGKNLKVWIDNAGAVAIWKKGYSTECRLSTTIVTAVAAVAAALGCSISLEKITRCSCVAAELADKLSKADFKGFRTCAAAAGWPLDVAPVAVPVELLVWLDKPVPDDDLATRLLAGMERMGPD